MKKYLTIFLTALLTLPLAACGSNSAPADSENSAEPSQSVQPSETTPSAPAEEASETKSLVVYFSWSGNTRKVAETIAEETGADIFEITTVNAYSDDYNTVLDEAQTEQKENARPEISNSVDNFGDYDVVYFGFPNWWGDMPMVMYSFLDDYDFSGKTIAPFVTSGGSGFSGALVTISDAEPNATVLEGLALSGSGVDSADDRISEWLTGLALAE